MQQAYRRDGAIGEDEGEDVEVDGEEQPENIRPPHDDDKPDEYEGEPDDHQREFSGLLLLGLRNALHRRFIERISADERIYLGGQFRVGVDEVFEVVDVPDDLAVDGMDLVARQHGEILVGPRCLYGPDNETLMGNPRIGRFREIPDAEELEKGDQNRGRYETDPNRPDHGVILLAGVPPAKLLR